ncbi:LacI family DNA-binding transcriptional regulator [Streptomyces sp. NPDC006879]|uniref:LacI family DNA-binding transcriptional regulator n=1 Tax=Streptomyces sp. NPDC006879 TaxID=3364767 RepID=UPI0036BEABD4
MGYGEKRGDWYRGRYWIAPGVLRTVEDADGNTIRFTTKREAAKAANDLEAEVRKGTWKDTKAEKETFGSYVNRWYEAQDLAASTMQNYKRHIEEHLLPEFEDKAVADIQRTDIDTWEKKEKPLYAASSVKTWRGTLHLILSDAVDEGLRDSNPATKRRGRGKRAGRSRNRAPEKVVTDALGILLIAERASLLSGRDDEFVATVLKGYTGLRWGEIVGLEPKFARPEKVRVEWQLYELDSGELHHCPPKDDSYRDIDVPEWLSSLYLGHIARTKPKPCACHGRAHVFSGYGVANDSARRSGVKLVDVARHAGVSTGTVSNVLNRPDAVAEATRAKVESAIAELGYVRGASVGETAAHWRRNGYATWLFQPAATGWYPKKAPYEPHPVPLSADSWPGVPVRGRNASGRAEACWLPIARGLTPHGLRHTHKTVLEELGTPPKLMDERMGHEDGSVQARYTHITKGMRKRLMDGLTEQWEESLAARLALSPRSRVPTLDALLSVRR